MKRLHWDQVLYVFVALGLLAFVGAAFVSCENGSSRITGTTTLPFPSSSQDNPSGDSGNPDQNHGPENLPPGPAPRQAKGALIVEGLYARCEQSTSYPLDTLSVFRVLEGGGQSHYATYLPPEGVLPCGQRVQVDCTVRDSHVVPGAISAYNLYDFDIFVTGACVVPRCEGDDCDRPRCEPTELNSVSSECRWNYDTCKWECKPCVGEWEVASEAVSYEGACEQRVKVTRTTEIHSCTQEQRVKVVREAAPLECSNDECVLPSGGSGVLDLANHNPTTECAFFGLVPGEGGFFMTKCGQFYDWGPSPSVGTCSNNQDVSHVTECDCPEDD